jgi:hypothetical protein
MELKTNKVIYAHKIKSAISVDWKSLKEPFSEDKTYDNFIEMPDRPYSAALTFLDEKNGIMFFSLSRCDKNNITVADFGIKRDRRSFLKDNQKVKNCSLFAVVKDYGIMLVLYDHRAFRHLCATLSTYLKLKLDKEIDFDILTRDLRDEEVKEILSEGTRIIIKRARKSFMDFEKSVTESPRGKIKKYKKSEETIIKLQIVDLPLSKKFELLNPYKKDYDAIVIDSRSVGEVDILDRFFVKFPCEIPTDKDGLALLDKFKDVIINIYAKNGKLFKSYMDS